MTSAACDRAGPRYDVHLLRNILVPISGGAELACDVYLPEGAGRCPTLVSPTPYRKDDYIGSAWQHVITYFVERGYAHVVADFRGLGSSSGVAAEAMSDSEAGDGVELVEWAASQPWSDGRVGMYGVSYGGISALRTAAARPPHLRAIIPLLATADPYDDFVYPGGCFNCLGVAAWSSYMHACKWPHRCITTRNGGGTPFGRRGSNIPSRLSFRGSSIRNEMPSGKRSPLLWS